MSERPGSVGIRRSLWRRPSSVTLASLAFGVVALVTSVALFDAGYITAGVGTSLSIVGTVCLFAGGLNHVLAADSTVPVIVGASLQESVDDLGATAFGDRTEHAVYLPASANATPPAADDATPRVVDDTTPTLFVPDETVTDFDADTATERSLPTPATADGRQVTPTGAGLYSAFEEIRTSQPGTDTATELSRAVDAVEHGFDLAETVTVREIDDGHATVAVEGVAFGDLGGYDHPIVSFLAVALAESGVGPVMVEVRDGTAETAVVYRWAESE